jgi:hypothetical protein
MNRVLLCYPCAFTVNQAWKDSVETTWAKAHPEEAFTVTATWEIHNLDRPEWDGLMQQFNAAVVVEEFDSRTRKEVLDERASIVARAALVQGKECWVYRKGLRHQPGMYRIADIREHDEQGRTRALVRRRKTRRKQP